MIALWCEEFGEQNWLPSLILKAICQLHPLACTRRNVNLSMPVQQWKPKSTGNISSSYYASRPFSNGLSMGDQVCSLP